MRPFDKYIKENLKDDSVGCELGVFRGNHAKALLDTGKIKKFYLVDVRTDRIREDVINDPRTVIIKSSSINAHEKIENESLDFLYHDSKHTYKFLLQEISFWYQKVRIGGVIGGDNFEPKFPDVGRVVKDFCRDFDYRYTKVAQEWWIVK